MSAHSPGPWYFHNNAAGYDELRSPNGEVIAQWGEWPALTKADAELIRSGPEILELLLERDGAWWSCGNPRDACLADGPCWDHRRLALLARIEKAAKVT